MIPLSVPHLGGREWAYVKECLDTGWVSSAGAFVDRFEREMARYTGANHAIACSCGTAALHVALIISGVGPDDEVIVPTLTFVATVNAVRYTGAHPVFMDCDCFYNIDPQKTLKFLQEETCQKDGKTWNKRTGRRIAAILPVHVFGNAAELNELLSHCRESSIQVVEDAAESLGTVYKDGPLMGRHTGTVGDVGALSFNGNKIITTGGGGMILTNNPERAARARYLTTQAKDDEVQFIHHEVGYNYRMNNVQAALGLAQLEQLPQFLEVKRSHYGEYARRLQGIQGLTLAPVPPYAENNHWLCAVQIDSALYKLDRDALMHRLLAKGIQARPVWYLNHLQQPYRQCQSYQIERAPELWESTLNLPSSVGLTQEQLETVSDELKGPR